MTASPQTLLDCFCYSDSEPDVASLNILEIAVGFLRGRVHDGMAAIFSDVLLINWTPDESQLVRGSLCDFPE